ARHMAKPEFYAYPDAVQPLLFWDGSVRETKTSNTQLGTSPNSPTTDVLLTHYEPVSKFEDPAPRNGQASEDIPARYQWTRNGLRGVDVSGTTAP
ncbi:MAG TPA: hypothetical protein VG963_06735, partial [Polyangiaceae bacterium]|nr:hypothetical protein [Polyangiaceae bacterium]